MNQSIRHINVTNHGGQIVVTFDRIYHQGKPYINPSNATMDRIARLVENGVIAPRFCWWRANGIYAGESAITFTIKD